MVIQKVLNRLLGGGRILISSREFLTYLYEGYQRKYYTGVGVLQLIFFVCLYFLNDYSFSFYSNLLVNASILNAFFVVGLMPSLFFQLSKLWFKLIIIQFLFIYKLLTRVFLLKILVYPTPSHGGQCPPP